MAGFIGKIEPFDDVLETWASYTERLEQYFALNEIEGERLVPALLTLLGRKTYGLLRNLCAPAKPSSKTYKELVEILDKQLSPKPSVITERFRFHHRQQLDDENVNTFLAELRKLSLHCQFDNLNDTLRDRFVCGLKKENIQKRLLSETTLPLEKALEIAVAMEMAAKDAIELQAKSKEASIQYIQHDHKSGTPDASRQQREQKQSNCFRCGDFGHLPNNCRFKNAICNGCGKRGHIKRACLSSKRPGNKNQGSRKTKGVHSMRKEENTSEEDSSDQEYEVSYLKVNTIQSEKSKPLTLELKMDGKKVKMEIDTGSEISVMSASEFENRFGKRKFRQLTPTKTMLRTFSGEKIKPLGIAKVKVEYGSQKKHLDLFIVEKGMSTLFGRSWLEKLNLNWKAIKDVMKVDKVKSYLGNTSDNTTPAQNNKALEDLLAKYETVFGDGIGKVKGIQASLTFKDGPKPVFCKARTIPFALRPKVEEELNKLEGMGIISKVNTSEWATPIVPVIKKNGGVRICGDFKVTLNQQLMVDQYPLPRIEDILASLSEGEKFTKLDLRQAYLHMEMSEESKKYLTVTTHKGLYQFNRLLFGVASAPAIWQRSMEQILQGIPGVNCILDDMIVTGKDTNEHLQNLESVLARLQAYNLKVNLAKCQFFQDKVEFCGHQIDKLGIHQTEDKIKAIRDTPRPQNLTQLRAFIGLVNYYHRFLPDIASILRPLHQLLEKEIQWHWSRSCEEAFLRAKELVISDQVLCHHSPVKPIRLACDASPYGVGAVLSHTFEDGSERPIAFASRTLTRTERNYSQIDKESLAIIFGIKKFHTYLYGRHFTLITDHQPLLSIFSPTKGLPATAAARLQRYAVFLAGYSYDIEYRNTKLHTNADALSRLVQQSLPKEETDPDAAELFHLTQFEQLPVTCATLRRETQKDRILSQVYLQTMSGWTKPGNENLLPYFQRRNEITVVQGCLMWGIRAIIPPKLRERILDVLHSTHLGVVKMKALARSNIWWPKIDQDIESITRRCTGCVQTLSNPRKVPIHPWEWPCKPWERIHIDFAGPLQAKQFLIIVDAHSKWPEIFSMRKITTTKTIDILRSVFARNGLPEQIVTDNGPQFTSTEFENFVKANGIAHFKSAPYHPATNGLAERLVRTFKQSLKAMKNDPISLNKKLANFLLMYRNAPHSTTNETPSKMFLGRNLRTRLDLIRPDIKRTVQEKQTLQSVTGRKEVMRFFEIGQPVAVRDYRGQNKWMDGEVNARLGPLMYEIKTRLGSYWRRHVDQIRETSKKDYPRETDMSTSTKNTTEMSSQGTKQCENQTALQFSSFEPQNELTELLHSTELTKEENRKEITQSESHENHRYPRRERKPPKRYAEQYP